MFERISAIVSEQLGVEAEKITRETDFKEDLGADSLDLFELVSAVEEAFGVEFETDDLEGLTTIKSLMDYLKGKGIE